MPRTIECPHCKRSLKITDDLIGKKITCAACKKKINLVAGPPTPKPPPVPSTAHPWHLHVHGRNVGPYGPSTVREQLAAGKINADTLAWKEGMEDWQPVGEIADFQEGKPSRPAAKAADDKNHEKRRHYVPGRAKRDAVMGAWIAVGLAVVLVAVLLIVYSRRSDDAAKQGQPAVAPIVVPPQTPTEVITTTPVGTPLSPKAATKSKGPRSTGTNEQFLTKLKADLDDSFKKAIAGHLKGERRPIQVLVKVLERLAADAGKRDWGAYATVAQGLTTRLSQAAEGILKELPDKTATWDLGEGLEGKARDDALGLKDYQWVESWQKHIEDDLKRIREKGMEF